MCTGFTTVWAVGSTTVDRVIRSLDTIVDSYFLECECDAMHSITTVMKPMGTSMRTPTSNGGGRITGNVGSDGET